MRDERINIVVVEENMQMDFFLQELEQLSSHLFAWHWLPCNGTTGHSGGILLGVKDATFEIGSMDRENDRPPPPPRFWFEAFWLNQVGFADAGDANTTYFQAIANGRRCCNSIPLLWDGESLLQCPTEIHAHVDDFFKALFSPSPWGELFLVQSFWDIHQCISDSENATLTAPFSKDKVWAAIKGMNPAPAPGPDSLPVKFFQTF
ncbi:putative NOT transcription complex subunit VIP2 [Hordeum vulgare]|nr:putative NOT transcription complex subunit VIP2 [Hordeum vulgare]